MSIFNSEEWDGEHLLSEGLPTDAMAVHTRDTVIEAFDIGQGRMLLRGELRDRRGERFQTAGTRTVEAGEPLHGMVCEFEIDVEGGMEILAAQGAMPHTPHPTCPGWLEALQELVGLRIEAGFNRKMRGSIAGASGCAHFTSLVTAMAPVAMQGRSGVRKRSEEMKGPDEDGGLHMANTCHVYAAD
jgi:hypothetical protein